MKIALTRTPLGTDATYLPIVRQTVFRRARSTVSALCLAALFGGICGEVRAQTLYWDGSSTAGLQAADGDFATSTFWNANSGGNGTLVTWTNNGTGTATFNGNNTSSVTLNSAGNGTNFYIQNSAANGSTTTINISGTSSLTLSSAIGVGWSTSGVASTGTAILNQSGGTISATGAMTVGRFGTNGTYTLTGGSLSASSLNIANGLLNASSTVAPIGVVNISGGAMTLSGAINVGNGGISGYVANGTLNINSGSLTAGGVISVSGTGYSNGVVNLNGGTLTVQQVTMGSNSTGSSSVIRLNGGTLKAGSNSLSGFMQGLTNAYVDNGGAFIDMNGRTINIGQDLLQGSGSGGLTVSSSGAGGNLTLNGNNTFSGATVISGGILILGNNTRALQNSALDTTNSVTGTATAGLRTTGANLTLGGLSGDKNLSSIYTTTSGGYSSVTSLTLNPGTGATNTYNGVISNGASGMGLTKTGAGTQILSAANTYTGATLVSAGTLVVNGSTSASSVVSVSSGATLGGNGTIGGAATINGNLTPGVAIGLLNFGSSLALTSTAITTMEINGTTRGTSYDAVNVVGALTNGGTLSLVLGTTFDPGNYSFNLFDFGSQTGAFDSIALSGTYSGLLTGSGDTRTLVDGVNTWTFAYSTGDLSLAVVPEPSTWALLALGMTSLMVVRRRRSA